MSKFFWTSLIIIALTVLVILAFQRRILFPTHLLPDVSKDDRPPRGIEQLWLGQPNDGVEAWLMKPKEPHRTSMQSIVLFFHGNAELIDDLTDHIRPYLAAGLSVALMEYRGYGRSAGSPSQSGLIDDAVELRALLINRYGFTADRFYYHGRSLGGGVATGLANRHPPRGLILESTFASIRSIAARMLIPGFLVLDPFDSERVLKR